MPLVACDRSTNQAPGVVCGVAVIGGFWLLCNLALGNWFVCYTQAHEKWINVSLPRVTIKTDKWGSLCVCQRSNCERLLCISAWCSVITLLWPDGEPSLTCADERPVCDVCWCEAESVYLRQVTPTGSAWMMRSHGDSDFLWCCAVDADAGDAGDEMTLNDSQHIYLEFDLIWQPNFDI